MSQPNTPLVSDRTDVDRAVEKNYSKKYLNELFEATELYDEELLSPYAQFYILNPEAGYAFYFLACIFKKIDALINVTKKSGHSPWEYFSHQASFVEFSKAIEALTERALHATTEPPIIEQIRKADRSRMRRSMLKRITDLDPARITFEGDVLENLMDRNSFFDDFLKVIHIKRRKKQSLDVTGLRQRKNEKVSSAERSHHGAGLSQTLISPSHEAEMGSRERVADSISPLIEFASRLFSGLKSLSKVTSWRQAKNFTGSNGTVLTVSIICLMATTLLASRALFLSLNDPQSSNSTASDFFTALQQNILSLFSQYVLVPYFRRMRLNNQRFWFMASLIFSTLIAITSMCVYYWNLPVSTFLGFVSNAAQVIATLLLIQEDSFKLSATPVSSKDQDLAR